MSTYTLRFIDPVTAKGIVYKENGITKEYLRGFCSIFGTTLYDDDDWEECLEDYHGLDITVNDDVPISIEDLCEDRYLITVRSEDEAEKDKYLAASRENFPQWFQDRLFEDMEVECPYTCCLIGKNHYIQLTQFESKDFLVGATTACELLQIDPKTKICEIHHGQISANIDDLL